MKIEVWGGAGRARGWAERPGRDGGAAEGGAGASLRRAVPPNSECGARVPQPPAT